MMRVRAVFFNWGSGSSALPDYVMAGWLLKKER
jgi:hypothetical protein